MNTHDAPTASATSPRLIFLHGIGNPKPNWFEMDKSALPEHLHPRCTGFYWGDLFEASPAGKRMSRLISFLDAITPIFTPMTYFSLRTLINAGVQWIALPFLKELLDKSSDILGYNSIQHQAFKRLESLILEHPEGVVLVAHSMGSVLSFEFLQSESPAVSYVKRLISLGSPLDRQPIKAQVWSRTQGATRVPCAWLNIWGTLDLICCWRPWRSGELNHFYADEQIKINWQNHNFAGYLKRIPLLWLI